MNSVNNKTDCSSTNAEAFGDLLLIQIVRISSVEFPHFDNLRCGQLMSAVRFSKRLTSFFGSIFHIRPLIAKEKVVWIDARSIIAVMQNVHALRNWSFGKYPRLTMRTNTSVLNRNAEGSISEMCKTCPDPAGRSFSNVFKEAIGKILSHGKLILSCAMPRDAQTSPGLFTV